MRTVTGKVQLAFFKKLTIDFFPSYGMNSFVCTLSIFRRFAISPAFSAVIIAVKEDYSINCSKIPSVRVINVTSSAIIGSEVFIAILLTCSHRSKVKDRRPAK